MLKKIIYIILTVDVLFFSYGIYLQYVKKSPLYEKVMGYAVILMVLVLLPLFLYHRYKNKNLEDFRFKKPDSDKDI